MNDNVINIKIFPALNGESFLLTIGEMVILIDGGYVNTYNDYLKSELLQLSKEGYSLSYLIVSHIDRDHISGIIKFLQENENDQVIPVMNIWHNSYRHIQKLDAKSEKRIPFADKDIKDLPINSFVKERVGGTKNVSAEQGSSLAALILKSRYNWNLELNGRAVSTDNKDFLRIDSNVKLFLLSPNNDKLKELKKYWARELYKKGYTYSKELDNYDDAFEFLIAQEKEKKLVRKKEISGGVINIEELSKLIFTEDNSASNGSSISFVLEVGDKKLLFLADSHPSLIIESLKKHYSNEKYPICFDVIKLSHHGSISNINDELLTLIDSPNIIVSTDGSGFNHPDIETIAKVINRKAGFKRVLYFNYPLDAIKKLDNKEFKQQYSYELIMNSRNSIMEINI